jgi:hypothetical protein
MILPIPPKPPVLVKKGPVRGAPKGPAPMPPKPPKPRPKPLKGKM